MAYPTNLDDFTNSAGTETLAGAGEVGLSTMLNNLNDSVESIEAKVGVDSSAVTTSLDYRVSTNETDISNKQDVVSGVSDTEIGYLDGVTSSIQTQLGTKASSGANSDITSLSGLTTTLTVAQGGSGAATLTGIVKGNGTSAFTAVTAPSGDIVGTSDVQTLTNKKLTDPPIEKPVVYGVVDLGTVGATESIDWTAGDRQKLTMDENLTITMSSSTPAEGQTLTLYMLQNGSGGNTPTFADTIVWADATEPTWTTDADATNIAVITYVNSTYFGVGNKFA